MDRDFQGSMIRVHDTWVPLMTFREMKAARRREIVRGACFIALITAVLFTLLWVTP